MRPFCFKEGRNNINNNNKKEVYSVISFKCLLMTDGKVINYNGTLSFLFAGF